MIKDFLQKKKVFVFDGAMGTMLQKYGLKTGSSSEELNLTSPDIIHKIHREYIEAGSDIIQTNTFGGNLLRLKHFGLEKKIADINKRAIEIARKSADKDTIVAVSIGPTGAILEPYGDTSREEVYEAFYQQLKNCDEADFINIETMQSLDEATIAIEATKNALSSKPISASITYKKTQNGYATIWGEDIETIVRKLEELNVDIIGSNCGDGFEQFLVLMSILAQNSKLPLLAKPNAGIPYVKDQNIIYPETPDLITDKVEKFIKIGVKIIGGCCGTTPEHIKKIREIVDNLTK